MMDGAMSVINQVNISLEAGWHVVRSLFLFDLKIKQSNRNDGKAMLLLLRFSTGENWNGRGC